MTYRDRAIKTLLCQETDRAPFGVGLGFWPWGETMQRWKEESGIEDLNIYNYFGYEPSFMSVPIDMGPLPAFENKVIEENDDFVISIDGRGITMRGYIPGADHLIPPNVSWENWKYYCEELKTIIGV
jgi:hypothetical protein